jgi:hypothetical protein
MAKIYITPYGDDETWKDMGWSTDGLKIELDQQMESVSSDFLSKSYITGQTITAKYDIDPEAFWTVDSISRQDDFAQNVTIFFLTMKNEFTGEYKKFYCSVTNEFMMSVNSIEDMQQLVIDKFASLMTGMQIKTFKIFLDENEKNAKGLMFNSTVTTASGVGYSTGGIWEPKVANSNNPSYLSQQLPGVMEKVKHPVDGYMYQLRDVIMSLNDTYKWSREKIADWVETLDVDTRFKLKEESNEQD